MTGRDVSRLAGRVRRAAAAALVAAVVAAQPPAPAHAVEQELDEARQARLDDALRAFRMADYDQALDGLGVLAEEGVAEAQFYLGFLHAQGLGIDQRFETAAHWYRRAAGQGHAEAQNHLGLLYFEGSGVPRSFRDAFVYFELAAAAGNQDAANNRLIVARKMTSTQITEAQRAAGEILAAQRVADAEVVVPRPVRAANGVVVTDGGLVLTVAEAMRGCADARLRTEAGETAPARLVAVDDFNALALVGGLRPRPPVSLRAGPLEAGEAVTVVGLALDPDSSPLVEASEAAVLRAPALDRVDLRYLQLDRTMAAGHLGAPVFDSAGRLAALMVPGLEAREIAHVIGEPAGVGFAMRADLVTPLLEVNGYDYDVAAADAAPLAAGLDVRLSAATVAIECWREDEPWPDPRQAAGSTSDRQAGGRRRWGTRARARRSFVTSAAASISPAASCRCSTTRARRSRRAPSAAASARAGRRPGSATRPSPIGWSAG